MFEWLRRRLRTRERRIFRYYDGVRWVAADPLEINERLETDQAVEDYRQTFKAVVRGEMEATTEFDGLLRRVFGIPPYSNGRGLTKLEAFELFGQWLQFVDGLKKTLGDLPMPLRRLIGSPSTDPLPTPNDAGSSSGETGSPDAGPIPCSVPSGMPPAGALAASGTTP